MPGPMQGSSEVGTVVGTGEDRGSVAEHLHPSTEAGQALIVFAVAFAILLLTVGRQAPGLRKLVVVGEFVLVISAASAVKNYAVRTWVATHPEAPGSAGLTIAF
jgi:hypothetical protein